MTPVRLVTKDSFCKQTSLEADFTPKAKTFGIARVLDPPGPLCLRSLQQRSLASH